MGNLGLRRYSLKKFGFIQTVYSTWKLILLNTYMIWLPAITHAHGWVGGWGGRNGCQGRNKHNDTMPYRKYWDFAAVIISVLFLCVRTLTGLCQAVRGCTVYFDCISINLVFEFHTNSYELLYLSLLLLDCSMHEYLHI